MHLAPTKKLNNGLEIPVIGFGTWKVKGASVIEPIKIALEAGYRHIDTAKIYGNEKEVGEAIKASGLPREEIFITTKLWNLDQGYESGKKALEKSLKELGLEYVNLYLIHWPETGFRKDSWRALEEIYKSGKAKAIGVSNYTIRHLEEMKEYANLTPAVNQVEFHPFLYQKELLEYCEGRGIQLEAYSPLMHGERMNNQTITNIANKHNKSNAQVLIRWSIQHSNVVLPKSTTPERITENINVFDFELLESDMRALDGLNENYRTCWDPSELK